MLGHRLAGEHWVPGIDAGVDDADGLTVAGLRAGPVLQLELRVGSIRPDRGQPPLVLEILLAVVAELDRFTLLSVLVRGDATEIGGFYATWRRRWRRLRCRWRRLQLGQRRTTASATRDDDEAENSKDADQAFMDILSLSLTRQIRNGSMRKPNGACRTSVTRAPWKSSFKRRSKQGEVGWDVIHPPGPVSAPLSE